MFWKNKTKQNILQPALLWWREWCRTPSPDEHFSPSLGRPFQGILHLCLPPGFGGGMDGLGVMPATGSTMLPSGRLLLQRGSEGGLRGFPTAMSRLRGCSRSGSSWLSPVHDVFDCLSLLLCFRKLLGKALDSIAEEAGL